MKVGPSMRVSPSHLLGLSFRFLTLSGCCCSNWFVGFVVPSRVFLLEGLCGVMLDIEVSLVGITGFDTHF